MVATHFKATALIVLLQIWSGTCQNLRLRFKEGYIVSRVHTLDFKILDKVENKDETIFNAIESNGNKQVSLRIAIYGEHEWKMFECSGATIQLEGSEQTVAEQAEAGIAKIYGLGKISEVDDNELNLSVGQTVLVMEPLDPRSFEVMLDRGDFAKDHKTRHSIGLQMLKTIAYLHGKRVRHGNFNPLAFAVLPSGDGRLGIRICLIAMFAAEICNPDGFLPKPRTYCTSHVAYRSLNLLQTLETKYTHGDPGPHINDDNESGAYCILEMFGTKLEWADDSIKVAKLVDDISRLQEGSKEKTKLMKKYTKKLDKIKKALVEIPIQIHKDLLKGNKQYAVLLEMIESARPTDLGGHVKGYEYKATGQDRKGVELYFISLWERTSAGESLQSKASGSSSKTVKPTYLI